MGICIDLVEVTSHFAQTFVAYAGLYQKCFSCRLAAITLHNGLQFQS